MATADGIRALASPALAAEGLQLWDVETTPDVVRILVERDGGVDLDALSDATRIVSELLDRHDELVPTGRYELEVSSPGLERTLRSVEQYRRYVGTTVTVKTSDPVDGARRHRGTLVTVDDTAIGLLPDDAPPDAVRRIEHDRIERARTVLEWGPAPKPGSRPKVARTSPGGSRTRDAAVPAAGATHDSKDRAR